MNPARRHCGTWLCLALLSMVAGIARADMVDITEGFWQDAEIVRPSSILSTDFTATTAGIVTIGLLDVHSLLPQWGKNLSTLSGSVQLASGRVLSLSGGATTMFQIAANEVFSTSVYAAVATSSGYGAYQLDLRFTSMAPVPLPPALWLLLAGCALLATRMRRAAGSFVPAAI